MTLGKAGLIVVVGVLSAGLSAPAAAQDKTAGKGPPEIVKALTDCRAIADDTQRLACFDQVSAQMAEQVEQKQIVVLDKQDVQETRRGLFGFSLPKLPFFGGDEGGERGVDTTLTEIETTIKSARSMGYGKWRFVLADDATWITTDPITDRDPEAGDEIKIKRAMFGSYNISVEGGRVVKGKREN